MSQEQLEVRLFVPFENKPDISSIHVVPLPVLKEDDLEYEYTDDMHYILWYLRQRGKLYVSGKVVENFYKWFSRLSYNLNWGTPIYAQEVERFAVWLGDFKFKTNETFNKMTALSIVYDRKDDRT